MASQKGKHVDLNAIEQEIDATVAKTFDHIFTVRLQTRLEDELEAKAAAELERRKNEGNEEDEEHARAARLIKSMKPSLLKLVRKEAIKEMMEDTKD